jgi:hypothetical protein
VVYTSEAGPPHGVPLAAQPDCLTIVSTHTRHSLVPGRTHSVCSSNIPEPLAGILQDAQVELERGTRVRPWSEVVESTLNPDWEPFDDRLVRAAQRHHLRRHGGDSAGIRPVLSDSPHAPLFPMTLRVYCVNGGSGGGMALRSFSVSAQAPITSPPRPLVVTRLNTSRSCAYVERPRNRVQGPGRRRWRRRQWRRLRRQEEMCSRGSVGSTVDTRRARPHSSGPPRYW